MKLKYQITFLASLCIVVACKKGNDGNNGGTVQPTAKLKYLTQITSVETSPGIGTQTVFTNYTYDDNKRLKSVKTGSNIINYAYDNGQLFSIERLSNGVKTSYSEFMYEGSKVKSALVTTYRNGAVFDNVTYSYIYNGDMVTEVHYGSYYQLYTYDGNNNLAKISYHVGNDYEVTYNYDDKKNKFINSSVKYITTLDPASDRFSPNNQIKSVSTLPGAPVINTTYVYDSEGYPTGGTSGTADNGSKFTYTYSTLE